MQTGRETGWAAGDYLDRPFRDLLDDVASNDPVPAAGSMLAAVGALTAGLVAKVARRSTAQRSDAEAVAERLDRLRRRLEPIITADAASYAETLSAPNDSAERDAAMESASSGPVLTAEITAEIAVIAAELVAGSNPNLRSDLAGAAWLAASIAEVATELTAANVGKSAPFQQARSAALRAREAAEATRL